MLTKQDLNAIGNLIETKLESKFEEKLAPIRKDIRKLRKDLTNTINFFDNRNLELEKKVDTTRSQLHLSELNFA